MMTRLTEYKLLKALDPTGPLTFTQWVKKSKLSRQTVSEYRKELLDLEYVDYCTDRNYFLSGPGQVRLQTLEAEFEEGAGKT